MNGYQITHFIGLDGVPVIQIDTADLDGMLRINLNDSTLYNGDPEKHEAPGIPVELPETEGMTALPTQPAAYWRPLVSLSEVWTLMRDGRWHHNITGKYVGAECVPEGLTFLGETKEQA